MQEVQKKLQSSENSITVSFQHPNYDILHSNFLNQILGKSQSLSEVFSYTMKWALYLIFGIDSMVLLMI